jgi:outer membrane biosynthesis protein TonB
MADPIEVNYVPDGDDWTVAVKGRGRTLTGRAPGLIAARDRADQLVEELAPDEVHRTVVHLLEGDAVEFTTAYLTARLAKPEPVAPLEVPASTVVEEKAPSPAVAPPRQTAAQHPPRPTPRPVPTPVPRPVPAPAPPADAAPARTEEATPTG